MKKLSILFFVFALTACVDESSEPSENPAQEEPSKETPTEKDPVPGDPVPEESTPEEPTPEEPVDPPKEEVPEANNFAELSWSAPLTRMNGTSITMGELSHYVLVYGPDSEDLSEKIVINDASEKADASYRIEDLAQGEWFFAVKVVDTDQLESSLSDVVSKMIN